MNNPNAGITELASLFLIVVFVYLLQCICWVSPRAVVFALGIRGRGKRRLAGFVWSAFDTAGLVANPLPPLTPLLVAQSPAFELAPDAIKLSGKAGEPIGIPWEKLEIKRSDTRLSCNGTTAFKGSEAQVLHYAELLERLQRASRGQRRQIIEDWLRRMMSAQATARRVAVFNKRSRWLRIAANFQFLYLFLLLPLAFEEFGARILWRAILILAIISISITVEFWSVHKALLPGARDGRLKSGLVILLSPMAAIRACDSVARDFLSQYHPLAIAGAVLNAGEFRRFAVEQLRLCRFGDYLDKQYQAGLQKAMEDTLKQKGLAAQELLSAPQAEKGCIAYCPRCLAQYTREREECSDCGYEGLVKFDNTTPCR